MSETFAFSEEPTTEIPRPTPNTRKKAEIQNDVAGPPLMPGDYGKITKNLREETDIRRRARISGVMSEARKMEGTRAAVRAASGSAIKHAVNRRLELGQVAAEIAREQSTLARVPERSIEDLTGRLSNLWANRQKLSFFDFAGKRAVDEQIKRTEDQLARAKENLRFEARSIVAQKLREVAPIKELPDSAVENLTPFESELAAKGLELGSLSALNILNWSKRSRLQEEIRVLKKKVAGEKIAAALKGKE